MAEMTEDMTPQQAAALRKVIAKWRSTADIWAKQERDKWPGGVRPDTRPSKRRSDTINWVVWLRACADEVEAALFNSEVK